MITVQECLDCEPDGEFGSNTERAVVDYQRDKGLEDDGVVGPQTWSWLEYEFELPPYPPPMLRHQMMAKNCPAFAMHTAAICLRNLHQHFGPINRKEAELLGDSDAMFQAVQRYLTSLPAV